MLEIAGDFWRLLEISRDCWRFQRLLEIVSSSTTQYYPALYLTSHHVRSGTFLGRFDVFEESSRNSRIFRDHVLSLFA
eukprot:262821-Amorphochlora_amoeboformis.AAC.1